jgi:NAD(P)H-hydrate epimerase
MIRLTRQQVRQIDQRAVKQYHIPGIVLMENAARAVAATAWEMLQGDRDPQVLLLCGGGNNGGDGLAAARHLHNHAANVTVALTVDPLNYKGDALVNFQIVNAMGLRIIRANPKTIVNMRPALVVDAIFGTGLNQKPRHGFAELVDAVREMRAAVLAVDLPSGMDCDTGQTLGACITATQTVTFVAQKAGFANPRAAEYLGVLSVADIGCPTQLIQEVAGTNP